MNKWEKLAELLGVAFNYPFEVSYKNKVFTLTITEYGIVEEGASASTYIYSKILPSLIDGSAEILPFKPKIGEPYWCVYWNNNEELLSASEINDGTMFDYLLIKNRLIFRTQEEAEKSKYRVYKELTGKEWA